MLLKFERCLVGNGNSLKNFVALNDTVRAVLKKPGL